jgi:hypothetical protein
VPVGGVSGKSRKSGANGTDTSRHIFENVRIDEFKWRCKSMYFFANNPKAASYACVLRFFFAFCI